MNRAQEAMKMILEGNLAGAFTSCVGMCYENSNFMQEYRQLTGSAFGENPITLQMLIDEATARQDSEACRFFTFVRTCVFDPWLLGLKEALCLEN